MGLFGAFVSKAGGRDENQDFCDSRESEGAGIWVLADGLGGHRGGAVASRKAVEAICGAWQQNLELSPEFLGGMFEIAQNAIVTNQNEEPRLSSMRTTLVILMQSGNHAIWGHVGDSRLYHFRDCSVLVRTKDHSVPQVMADAGEISEWEMRKHPDRNRILRAVGNPEGVRPTMLESPRMIMPGDAFLLCSDGFWEYITEVEMEADLAKSSTPEQWLNRMELRLLDRVEAGNDNYTAMAVFTGEQG